MSGGTPIAGPMAPPASIPSPSTSWGGPSALHLPVAPRVALPVAPYYSPSGWGVSPTPSGGGGSGHARVTPPASGYDSGSGGDGSSGGSGDGSGGGDGDAAGQTPSRISLSLPSSARSAGLSSPFSVSPAWSSARPTPIVRDAEMLKAAWLLSEFATPPPAGSGRTDEGGRGREGGGRWRDGWQPLGGSNDAGEAIGLSVAHSPGCTAVPKAAAGKRQGRGGSPGPTAPPPSLPPPSRPRPSPPSSPPQPVGRTRKRGGASPQALRGAPVGGARKKRRGPVGLAPAPPARGGSVNAWPAAATDRRRPPPTATAAAASAVAATLPPLAGNSQPPLSLSPSLPLPPMLSLDTVDDVWPGRGRPAVAAPTTAAAATSGGAATTGAPTAAITRAGSPAGGGSDLPISPMSGGRTNGSGRTSSDEGSGSGGTEDDGSGSSGAIKECVLDRPDRQLPRLPPIHPVTSLAPATAARPAALAATPAVESVARATVTHEPAVAHANRTTTTAAAAAVEAKAMTAASAAAAAAVEVPPALAPGGDLPTAGGTRLSALARAKARARLAADRFAELRKIAKAAESDTAVAAVAAARAAAEADGGTPASRSRLTYMQYRRRLQLNQQSAAVSRVYRQRYPDELEAEVRAVEASLAAAGGVAAALRAENGQLRAAVEAAVRGRGWGGRP